MEGTEKGRINLPRIVKDQGCTESFIFNEIELFV